MWDTPYLTGVARRELMSQCQDDELSAYFSLGNCMNGLDLLFRTLYGVRLELAPLASNEAWSPDIYKVNNFILEYFFSVPIRFWVSLGKNVNGKKKQDIQFT